MTIYNTVIGMDFDGTCNIGLKAFLYVATMCYIHEDEALTYRRFTVHSAQNDKAIFTIASWPQGLSGTSISVSFSKFQQALLRYTYTTIHAYFVHISCEFVESNTNFVTEIHDQLMKLFPFICIASCRGT